MKTPKNFSSGFFDFRNYIAKRESEKRNMKKIFKGFIPILIAISFFLIISCQVIKRSAHKLKALSHCKFELVSVDKKVSFTQHVGNIWNYVIELKIAATNPDSENIKLSGYKLDLYANNKWITNIATDASLELKAKQTTTIIAKAIISPSGAWSVFWKKLMNKKIEYKIVGTFYLRLGIYSLPIRVQLFKIEDNPN